MAVLPRHAAVLAAVLLTAACGTARTTQAIAPSVDHGTTVAGTPAASARAAAGPTTAPRPTLTVPPCTAGRLRISVGTMGAAGGTRYWGYRVQLRGGQPCTLTGVPPAVALDGDRRAAVRVKPDPRGEGRWSGRTVRISSHRPAWITLGWGQPANYVCTTARVAVTAVRLSLPGGTVDLPGRHLGAASGCRGDTPSGGPPPLSLAPFYVLR